MANNYKKDRLLIACIKKGDTSALEEIYCKNYLPVRNFVCKNSGSVQDAEDIYQDSIIDFLEAINMGKLDEITCGIGTYVFSIAKNKWLYQLRKKSNSPKPPIEPDALPESLFDKLDLALDRLGSPCLDILLDFYYSRHSMEQIAQTYGYKNANVAKSKKNKCVEKVRTIVQSL